MGKTRTCRRCAARLSRYNPDDACAGCAKGNPGSPVPPSWWLDSEPLRKALSGLDLGSALKIIRAATGLNQLEFAAVLGWDQSEISRAERGERATLYDIRRLREIADALDMPRTALTPLITGGDHESPRCEREGATEMMNRRELGGTLLGLAAATGLGHIQIPAKVDLAHVRYFHAAVDQLYAQDQSVGGASLVQDGLRLYHRARRMLDESDYSGATGHRLLSAAGELAVCVGWLCYDADDQPTARALYSEANFLANQAGDRPLAITTMELMTLQLVRHAREKQRPGYARQAVGMIERATELARHQPSPHLHSLLAAREAVAQSAAGNSAGFHRAISYAWREMDKANADEVPRGLKFVNRSEIASHEALGRWDLGDPGAAVEWLRTSLDADLSPRNESIYRAVLASALADAGDLTGAFTESTSVLATLAERKIRSARTTKRLREVRRLAAEHADGTDFSERFDEFTRREGPM